MLKKNLDLLFEPMKKGVPQIKTLRKPHDNILQTLANKRLRVSGLTNLQAI